MKKAISVMFAGIIAMLSYGCGNKAEAEVAPKTYLLYMIGDNNVTIRVEEKDLGNYLNDYYKWSIEPTTLMYAADGRTTWIWNSEVDLYKSVCWSTYPPVTIYSATSERNVLVEEVDDYLATGVWFKTKKEAKPITVTMDAFTKTNFKPDDLEKILTKGLSGYGQAFYDMEDKFGINSIFAISVAELESGYGTSSAFRNKNNAFGIGPGKRFATVEAGIDYFGSRYAPDWMDLREYRTQIMELNNMDSAMLYAGQTLYIYK